MSDSRVIFEKSVKDRMGIAIPKLDVPEISLSDSISPELLRETPANLPEVSEPQVVRHYVNLSVKNHHVDKDLYPLGSCTMKYNPKINDALASLPGFANIHPHQPVENVQGALHIMYELEQMLLKITGMSAATLQPSAGSQGEFAGILIMKKYHEQNGENRKYIIIPETAHGTNPASVSLGGFKAREVKSDNRGRVDFEDLKSKLDDEVAGMMLTQPNTLGLFEDQIEAISEEVHKVGALMYMDGANMNAVVGLCKPCEMGFDIVHINLHKTFSTPHGGGGPGAGPVMVTKNLEKYLPYPHIKKEKNTYKKYKPTFSVGRLNGFFGSYGIILRAYVYIRSLGIEGLKEVSENAIISANYIQEKLKGYYELTSSRYCMHETVLSASKQKQYGVKAIDIAKKLLDEGFHAPTMYFPLIIEEALMIEPTESESKETIDNFIKCMVEISKTSKSNPQEIINAPVNLPVERLDEALAARNPILTWKK